jgi:hypothetical protein
MNEIARIQEFIERDYKKGIAEADERDQVHRQWLADTVEQNTCRCSPVARRPP